MAKTVELGQLGKTIQARVLDRMRKFDPGDRQLKVTLLRIGLTLETQIKLNIRSRRLIDTGRLLNSIRSEYFQRGGVSGVTVGSYGVPYAAVHEFGFSGSQRIPSHTRTITQAFGKPLKNGAVTYQVGSYSRNVYIPKRPYMRPALKKQKNAILAELQKLFRKN